MTRSTRRGSTSAAPSRRWARTASRRRCAPSTRGAGRPARRGRLDATTPPTSALRLGPQALPLPRRQRRELLMSYTSRRAGPPRACASPRPSTAPRSPPSSAPPRPASTTSAAGAPSAPLPHFDDLLFLGASMSRYPLEGYRERCGTDVVLGDRHAKHPLHLDIPVTIAGHELRRAVRAGEGGARARRERGRHLDHDRRRRHDARGTRAVASTSSTSTCRPGTA